MLAYLITRIRFFGDLLNRRLVLKESLFLGFVCGIASIYGTVSAVQIFGALASFRDLGPAIAGLLGGPLAGGIAGLMGGAHRYLMGGSTALPCSVATIAAGLICGGYHLWKRGRKMKIVEAALLMTALTLLHVLVIAPVMLGVSDEVRNIVCATLVPMVMANGAGIAVFFFIIQNHHRERQMEREKLRIDSELSIAYDIQTGMLPLPGRKKDPRYDVYAVMKPAKEVGGDLYNFFFLDENRLCLVVGDVAGKGIYASLYMATAQKLLKAFARTSASPAVLLKNLNGELCPDNETMTFITLFIAFVDVRTGETVFANGGHNPPFLVRSGNVERLVLEPGLALGIREKTIYRDQQIQILPGDILFLYTDGVTEAENDHHEFFSEKRLKASLLRLADQKPERVCCEVLDDVALFVGPNEQNDDMTLLAFRMNF